MTQLRKRGMMRDLWLCRVNKTTFAQGNKPVWVTPGNSHQGLVISSFKRQLLANARFNQE